MMQAGPLFCISCFAQLQPGQVCHCSSHSRAVPYEELPSLYTVKAADGRWICPKCENHNLRTATKCSNCPFVSLEDVVIDSAEPAASPAPFSESPPATGKLSCWTCPKCAYEHNLYEYEKCYKCLVPNPRLAANAGAPKPTVEVKGGDVVFQGQCWTCPQCTYEYNLSDYDKCNRCLAPNPRLAANIGAPKPIVEVKGGDVVFKGPYWTCPRCSYEYNMQVVMKCTKCPFSRAIPAKQEGVPLQAFPARSGWTCQCGNSDIKADVCSSCGRIKQQATGYQLRSLAQERQPVLAEWMCSTCGCQKNTTLQCTSCSMPKGYAGQPPDSQSQSMWQCVCANWNPQDRDACCKCRKIKQTVPKEVAVNLNMLISARGWVCRSCFRENPVRTNQCQHCNQLNEVAVQIQRFLA